MVEKWSITIPELTGDEPRNAYVYLPQLCLDEPEVRLPVLYMFDGHNVFFDEDATYGKSWGMERYMDETETPLIIAAVECNHDPNNGRLSEYAPYTFRAPDLGYIPGRGRLTMEWMVNRFKPYVDEHFPTLPDRAHTFLSGSSMGGLMTLYGITEYNRVFSRGAALSPSVWFSPDKLNRLILHADIAPDTVLYMDYGSREMPNHPDMRAQFRKVVSHLLDRQVLLTCRIVPGGDHSEASWEKQIPFFMNTLLYELE
jgi:predicted alpha/beta superfamily hydrolase